jgi:AraC-like DNA-binding protein
MNSAREEMPATEESRFWRPAGLDGAELIFTSCGRYSFPRHFHEEYTIAIMVRGVERLRHEHGNELAPRGSLILVNPGQVHENGAVDDGGFAYRTLYAPIRLVQRCLEDAGLQSETLPEFPEAVVLDRETFVQLQQLHLAVEAGDPVLRLQTLLAEGLSRLFCRHATVPSPKASLPPSRRRIARVREYLDAHFAANVSLSDLSRLTGLSAFHLVRSFCGEFGLPPCQYQIQRRVRHALERLRQGVPISQAAYEAGFADQSHLNRHFKRIVGVTPGQFRADRKNVQDA